MPANGPFGLGSLVFQCGAQFWTGPAEQNREKTTRIYILHVWWTPSIEKLSTHVHQTIMRNILLCYVCRFLRDFGRFWFRRGGCASSRLSHGLQILSKTTTNSLKSNKRHKNIMLCPCRKIWSRARRRLWDQPRGPQTSKTDEIHLTDDWRLPDSLNWNPSPDWHLSGSSVADNPATHLHQTNMKNMFVIICVDSLMILGQFWVRQGDCSSSRLDHGSKLAKNSQKY